MKKEQLKGISLIVIVITIIVVIIIAGAIILNLTKNNPIDSGKKATFLNDLDSFKSELLLYKTNIISNNSGEFDENKLQADDTKVTYTGAGELNTTGKTIKDIISGLSSGTYENEFSIVNGELVYKGTNEKRQEWAIDAGIKLNNDETNVIIATTNILPIENGTDMTYIIRIFSNIGIKNIADLTGKVVVTDKDGIDLQNQPEITIGNVIELQNEKQLEITIKTQNMTIGEYKLKLKADSVENIAGVKNEETLSINNFEISKVISPNPVIVPSESNWTNQNISVTITYPGYAAIKQYSIDNGTTWNTFSSPIDVSENGTTIIAIAKDSNSLQIGSTTMTVSNIDRIAPTIDFTPNGSSAGTGIEVTVKATDLGGSGISESDSPALKCKWDTQNINVPSSFDQLVSNGSKLSTTFSDGKYYLWVKTTDRAGNSIVSVSNSFEIDKVAPTNPVLSANITTPTNGDVTVTITYSSDASIKEYSLDGSTWLNYTAPVVLTTNDKTVYARAKDLAGNQSGQATLTISNIDKVAPSVTLSNGGVTTSSITVIASASDNSGSGINTSSYQYSKDNGSTWTSATSSTSNTFTGLLTGTYQCKVKVLDKAGNSTVSTAVAITTQSLGTVTFTPSTTAWTNSNVIVTITYPSEAVTKQYSTNGTTWNAYTTPYTVSTNNTTLYARGLDSVGNQTSQATLTVSNIDKTNPINTVTTLNGIIDGFASVNFAAQDSDSGISNIYVYVDGSLYHTQTYTDNKVTLQTLNIDIDFPFQVSKTVYIIAKDFVGNTTQSNTLTLFNKDSMLNNADLTKLATLVNSGTDFSGITIKQLNNIDVSRNQSNPWIPIGNLNTPFKGIYDGNGKTISGVYINSSAPYQGLFGYIYTTGQVKNLGVINSTIISSNYYVGGISGFIGDGATITNCYSGATVTSTGGTDVSNGFTGGVIGRVGDSGGTVTNCYNTGTVTGTYNTGGVVGIMSSGNISGCYNTGTVNGTAVRTGGVVGSVGDSVNAGYFATVTKCYNTGTVNGNTINSSRVGGVAGYAVNGSTISESFNSGAITNVGKESDSTSRIGGILGFISTVGSNSVINCYNTGNITTTYSIAGGILGGKGNSTSIISNCYNTGTLSGGTSLGGIVGETGSNVTNCFYLTGTTAYSTGGTTLTTGKCTATQIQNLTNVGPSLSSTYWKKVPGVNNDYPILAWQ